MGDQIPLLSVADILPDAVRGAAPHPDAPRGQMVTCLRPGCGGEFKFLRVKGRIKLYCCRRCKDAHGKARLRNQRDAIANQLARVISEAQAFIKSIYNT